MAEAKAKEAAKSQEQKDREMKDLFNSYNEEMKRQRSVFENAERHASCKFKADFFRDRYQSGRENAFRQGEIWREPQDTSSVESMKQSGMSEAKILRFLKNHGRIDEFMSLRAAAIELRR